MIEELSFGDGNKSIEFSDFSDPGSVNALIEMENYDNQIGWYLDTEEAVKVRDWLSTVIERATGKPSETAALEARIAELERPIDMLLFCPMCGLQHVDAPQPEKDWDNPPHRSHECQFCGHVWRPADVFTNGVTTIQTKGQRDGDPAPCVSVNDALLRATEDLLKELHDGVTPLLHRGKPGAFDVCTQRIARARKVVADARKHQQPNRQE